MTKVEATALAEEALALVHADATQSLAMAKSVLQVNLDRTDRITALRAAGLASRLSGTMAESINYLEEAAGLAGDAGEQLLQAECVLSLTGSLALAGQADRAVALLEGSRPDVPALAAKFDFQLGSVLGRQGRFREALAAFDRVLPQFEKNGEPASLALLHTSRGRVRLEMGDLESAEEDIRATIGHQESLGNRLAVATASHNLGELLMLRGDLQQALQVLDRSGRVLDELAASPWEPQVVRGEVLLSAGLSDEAAELASDLVRLLGESGLEMDQAEAYLLQARAELRSRNTRAASDAALVALDLFTSQKRSLWALRAEILLSLCAETSADQLSSAESILGRLNDVEAPSWMRVEALSMGIRAALDCGDDAIVERWSALLDGVSAGQRPDVRITQSALDARVFERAGERRRALAAVRRTLDLAERHQASLSAIELAMASTWNIAETADVGVRLAATSNDAGQVFSYVERARSISSRTQPLQPPQDEEVARLAGRLRALVRSSGAGTADGVENDLRRLATQLRDAERRRGRGVGEIRRTPDLRAVRAGLGGRTLLSLYVVGGRLHAQWITTGSSRRVDLGRVDEVVDRFARVRRRLDLSARGLLSDAEVSELFDGWQEWSGLSPYIRGEVVLLPPAGAFSLPWAALPGLRDVPVTVAPSAFTWMHNSSERLMLGRMAVAAAPGLVLGREEAGAVAAIHRSVSPTVLLDEQATSGGVVDLLSSSDVLHLACHARHRKGNPLFSSLELADGPLLLMELAGVGALPGLVVLSSCDAAATDQVGAVDVLGLASALLRFGVRSVVAGSGLVADSEETVGLMSRFHERLRRGDAPATALVAARAGSSRPIVDAATFTVYGASPPVSSTAP